MRAVSKETWLAPHQHAQHLQPCCCQDVKTYAAFGLVHVLRVYVPESPYSTSQLQARLRLCVRGNVGA